jgi:hypothetical protein
MPNPRALGKHWFISHSSQDRCQNPEEKPAMKHVRKNAELIAELRRSDTGVTNDVTNDTAKPSDDRRFIIGSKYEPLCHDSHGIRRFILSARKGFKHNRRRRGEAEIVEGRGCKCKKKKCLKIITQTHTEFGKEMEIS